MQNNGIIPLMDDEQRKKDLISHERNQITVLEECIPSPIEIQAQETIVLPEIISMPDYIRRHYERGIISACKNQIYCLQLCVMYEGKLFHGVPGLGPIDYGEEELILTDELAPGEWSDPCEFEHQPQVYAADVRPVDGSITWMSFRRIADGCIEADLTIEMEFYFRYGGRGRFKQITQKYYTTLWLDMDDRPNVEFGDFSLWRHSRKATGVKLDEYLVPVLKWDDIEEESENIIFDAVSEGLSDPKWLQPGLLARRLGLNIIRLPLYKRPRTASILFFGSGEVLTAVDLEEKLDPVPVKVDGNTIVLNSQRLGQERDAIFHECFHYVEHRLFFQLQQLHNTDISRLAQWSPVKLEKEERSPLEWIEWQAHVGSQCLQMPKRLLKQRVSDELADMRNLERHMGFKMQVVGRKLAKEFGVYNYQMRKGYNWTSGGVGVAEAIGTDKALSSKYGGNGCPDKSANGMFTYAKSQGCAWGTIDTLPEIPGVALRSDGHIGVYVGDDHAVEERGFSYGCVKTKVSSRKWTHWFQLPFVDYGDATFTGGSYVKPDTSETEYTLGTRTLKDGSKGTDVKTLQEFLLQLEYSLPKYGDDGEFGAETEKALLEFQQKVGIKQDGIYGSETHQALMDAVADDDEGKADAEPEVEVPGGATSPSRQVRIICGSGSVNIRVGNDTKYSRITSVKNGATYEWVATAENGWHAIVVNAQIGWVSGKYSQIA